MATALGATRKPAASVEWIKIKAKYLTENLRTDRATPYSYTDIAREFGVVPGTVRNRASKEKWKDALLDAVREKAENDVNVAKEATSFDEAETRHRQATYARVAQAKAILRLRDLDASSLTIREAIDLLKLGLNEERSALGLPNEYIAAQDRDDLESPMAKARRYSELKDLGLNLVEFLTKKAADRGKSQADPE